MVIIHNFSYYTVCLSEALYDLLLQKNDYRKSPLIFYDIQKDAIQLWI